MIWEEDMWVETDAWGHPTYRFSRKTSVSPQENFHHERDEFDFYSEAESVVSSPEWCD